MPAPISIVIPTLRAANDLPDTLAPLVEGVARGLVRELVVSDGGSDDATCEIAQAAGAVVISGPPGRGGQMRRGAASAKGAWILFLHADTHLSPGWSQVAQDHMAAHPEQAGYFRLAFRAPGAWPSLVAGWANFRSRAFGLPYGDQGLLISRELLTERGGVQEIPLMEDVALARSLRGSLTPLRATASTSAERFLTHGWIRQGSANLWRLIRYLLGADPKKLAIKYRR